MEISELQARINKLLSAPMDTTRDPSERASEFFCTYNAQHMQLANDWASAFGYTANQKDGIEGLADAISGMEKVVSKNIPGLIQHAIKLFLVRNNKARAHLYLEPLEARQPSSVSSPGRGRGPSMNI